MSFMKLDVSFDPLTHYIYILDRLQSVARENTKLMGKMKDIINRPKKVDKLRKIESLNKRSRTKEMNRIDYENKVDKILWHYVSF